VFTVSEAHSLIGKRVRALVDLPAVSAGTPGTVETPVRVVQEWDLRVIWQKDDGTERPEWFSKTEFTRACQVE
jgi:hypothetical protein